MLPPGLFSILMSSMSTVISPSSFLSATDFTALTASLESWSLLASAPFPVMAVAAIFSRVSTSSGAALIVMVSIIFVA